MEIPDFIEEYQQAFSKDYCERVIERFEELLLNQNSIVQMRDIKVVNDDRIVYDWASYPRYYYDQDLCEEFYSRVHQIYSDMYCAKYDMVHKLGQHTPKSMSVQRTGPGQGFHTWHCESGDYGSATRVLAYTLYLNTIREGGETEFLYQHKRVKAEQGKLVLWPTGYTHTHRGNPPLKEYKYIITGWYTFDYIDSFI